MTVEILRHIDQQPSRAGAGGRRAKGQGLRRQKFSQGLASLGEATGGGAVVPMREPEQTRRGPVELSAPAGKKICASPEIAGFDEIKAPSLLDLALRLKINIAVNTRLRFGFFQQDISPLVGREGRPTGTQEQLKNNYLHAIAQAQLMQFAPRRQSIFS